MELHSSLTRTIPDSINIHKWHRTRRLEFAMLPWDCLFRTFGILTLSLSESKVLQREVSCRFHINNAKALKYVLVWCSTNYWKPFSLEELRDGLKLQKEQWFVSIGILGLYLFSLLLWSFLWTTIAIAIAFSYPLVCDRCWESGADVTFPSWGLFKTLLESQSLVTGYLAIIGPL